jgi:hypothetical protein
LAIQKPSRRSHNNPRSRRLRNPDQLRWRERYRQNTSIKGVPFGRRSGVPIQRRLTFEYESELRQDGTGSLFLRCVGPAQQFCHWVSLCSTVPHYGGRRWWFICPVKKIRIAKLYLPPGATRFASRQAYSLTYRSCQRPFRLERVRRRTERLARQMSQNEARFRELMKRANRA